MRFQSYFNSALLIIEKYDGAMPLQHFLRKYFAVHKKHGSKDRKQILQIVYQYFRLGDTLKNAEPAEQLLAAIFLCNQEPNGWAILYEEHWLNHWHQQLAARIQFLQKENPNFHLENLFPFPNLLSAELDPIEFAQSHFIQPDLFLRIRPGFESQVPQQLLEHDIRFEKVSAHTLALQTAVKLEGVIDLDKQSVVQDASSQIIAEYICLAAQLAGQQNPLVNVWDTCAASGGKSILANDCLSNIHLTVSDLRSSILKNLAERFFKAGIFNYTSFVADLSKPFTNSIPKQSFDLVICDAPCSGSGTWGRTPEQMKYFSRKDLEQYETTQEKMVAQIIPYVKKGGFFLYITCSVYQNENENRVQQILANNSLQLIKQSLIQGYPTKADTMFAALFQC